MSVAPLPSQYCQSEQSSEGPSHGGIARSEKPKPSATGKTGIKRKLDVKTIEVKYNAIMEVEKGQKSKAQIARDLKINSSTLATWVKNAANIKEGYLTYSPKRKTMKTGKWDELESALLQWFKFARDKEAVLSGPTLIAKAEQYAQSLQIEDFHGTTGWLHRFKERNGIVFRSINGESRSVNDVSDDMEAWKKTRTDLLQRFNAEDVYNADETGLFFKMLPEKTLDFKGVDCNGGKRSKERLTVMVCTNMSGTDKLPLFIIGKSAKPRCFKNVKTLQTQYTNNKKAWMTGQIFEDWLRKIDREMKRRGRRITMVVDNAPCHPKLENLSNIELIFLPPNTTSKTQPMDQGVIQNLKVHYRKRVVLRQLSAIDNDHDFTLSVLDALRLLQQLWECVTPTTITNCYRHAGFMLQIIDEQGDDDDTDELDDIPLARLASMGTSSELLGSFLDFDDNDATTSASATDPEIISQVIDSRKEIYEDNMADDDDEDDDFQPPPLPTADEAMAALTTVREFLESMEDTHKESKLLCTISRTILRGKMTEVNKLKQTSIKMFTRDINQ
ncbi:tigger transposable element-derived protein 4-like [Mercenaria mercenaria]|uniref:tigger transposable element-derived protein 4-like n=1 Tax=Mercenaria mercenaria TaxID=6596 RepID=UPI00234E37E3|nr:tigger transposable element-derived protein 4-like [Mercenaria mercenaria]